MEYKFAAIAVLSTVASLSSFGDIYWTGASAEATKYWEDAANWNGTGGNYVVRTAEMQNAPVEVGFQTQASISTGFWIENSLEGVVTFKAESLNNGLTMSSTDMHVGGAGGPGALVVDGGTYHFANDLFVGFQNGRGRFTLKRGRAEMSFWMPIGDGNGGSPRGDVVVEGGELVVGVRDGVEADNARLELGRSSGATATFLQLGGTVGAQGGGNAGDRAISIGEAANSTCVYTISNGTCVARSHYIGLANGSNSKGTLNIHGGTVETLGVVKGSGAASLDFDGGTLKAKGADTLIASGVAVSVGQNGGTISSDFDVTIGAAVSGSASGALVKTGSGRLTFSESFAGLVTIEEGSVISQAGVEYTSGTFVLASGVSASLTGLPVGSPDLVVDPGATLAIEPGCSFGAITIGEGAKIVINEDGSQAGIAHVVLSFASLALPDGADAADCISVMVHGAEASWMLGDTAITVSAASTTWTGAANNGGLYKTPENWSNGVPDASMEVVFDSDASVQLTGNEPHSLAKLTISNNATVQFHPESMDNYPSIIPGAVAGSGTIELRRCGLVATSAVTVPDTIAIYISNDGQQLAHDSWLQGASAAAPLTINGPVTVANYLCLYEGVAIKGRLELLDGSCLALDVFDTRRSASSTVSEVYVADGNTALCNHKGLGSNVRKTGAGTLQVNLTGYDELIMEEGTASLASNEGPSKRFTFQGGVLQLAYAMNWFDELVNRINNSTSHTGAIRLDTALDVTLNTALGSASTTYGFEKLGDSTLTLTSQPVYTGDTKVSAGTLKIPAGTTLPGKLTIAEGAKVVVVVDPAVWLAGYTGTLLSYGSLAEGQALGRGNIVLEGIPETLGFVLDVTEAGTVKATITGDQLIWNGGNGEWTAANVWKGSSSSGFMEWSDGYDVLFSGADMSGDAIESHTVTISEPVLPANFYSTAGEGKSYRLTGEGVTASTFTQSGAGSIILANEFLAVSGSATVSSGELVLEGATLSGAAVANSATIRASGNTESKIASAVSGSGSISIDGGSTLQVADQWLHQSVTGEGTLLVTNGWLTITYSRQLSGFYGDIRLAAGGILYESSEFNNDLKGGNVYPLGYNSKISFAGGTLDGFYNNNNTVIQSALHMEDGTTSYLNNTHQRSGAGNNMWLFGALTGAGNLVFRSNGRQTHLYGNAADFHGEMDLVGGLFQFMNEVAAGSNSVWNCTTANNYDILNGAGTTIRFGALNVTQPGGNMYVANAGAVVEIGAKSDSVVNGGFIGAEFTLNKVGDTSLVVQGSASGANVVVAAGGFGGTATIKSLAVADGAKIAFADLSDVKQTYQGPTVLSEPQWSKLPEVWNGRTARGRWMLDVAEEEVTPEEGDAYTVWKLSATFRPAGLILHLR